MGILDLAMSAARRSLWFRLLLPVGVGVSISATVEAIIPGAAPGSVGGIVLGLALPFHRYRRPLRLPKKQRVLFHGVLSSGRACAEPEINELVREDLARAVSNSGYRTEPRRSDRIVLAVVTALPVALAVVAAVLRSPWWLLESLATPLMILYKVLQPSGDPRQRLERLLDTMGPAD